MQNLPLVSIIIPTYNNSPEVCQAIDCSLSQTYLNREVIVIDDGSSDDTERLLREKYAGTITYIRQENMGTGSARNTGIRHAAGQFLQFLDADDLIALDKISIQMEQLLSTPEKAVSYCQYVCCDMDNKPVSYKPLSPVLGSQNPFEDIMMKWETEVSIPIHCFIFDAALFRETGINFDESLTANEDWDCWMSVFASRPRLFFVDKVLAYYRMRCGSRASDRLKMRNSYLSAIQKQIQKNWLNKEIVHKLVKRKKQIKYHYSDVSRVIRVLETFHPTIKKLYVNNVPWRIQRIFD